jgi:phosphoribosylglycinamide formyltransferase-1
VSAKLRLGVLASGGGTNLQAILDACREPGFPAEVAVVLSNLPRAGALERARKAGVPAELVDHTEYKDRDLFEAELVKRLQAHGAELICLAGFMRILRGGFLRSFPGRVINIHPSLLPSFPGLHAQRQALQHGVKLSGCTVHFVDEGTDTGPIIVQAAVPVLEGDDEAALSARILVQEHRCYPLAIRLIAGGDVTLEQRTVRIGKAAAVDGVALRNPG